MERQVPQPSLSSEERIALDAAIADLCYGGQASATTRYGTAGNLGNQAFGYGYSRDVVCCDIAHHSHFVDVDPF